MNCIVPSLNIKVLARAVHALAKIGDELFIEAKIDKLTFLTFNQSKTVCGQFHMLDSFFSLYNVQQGHAKENTAISLKIHMKTLLPLFRGTHLDKKLESLRIEYVDPSDLMKFKVKYKADDIVMSHDLCLMDPEILTIDNYGQSRNNSLCAGSDFFNSFLNLFSTSDDSITFEITRAKVIARNYYIGAPHNPKSVRSHVNLSNSEFALFKISEETTVNFSLKPFRTAIAFADSFNLNISIDFDAGGRPLSISMRNPTFEVLFVVATINPYTDAPSTIGPTSLPAKITQVNIKGSHNLTHDDLEAIANENWDDFEDDPVSKSDKNSVSENTKNDALFNRYKTSTKDSKKFVLEENDSLFNNNSKQDGEVDNNEPESPESPRSKRVRYIFKRSFEPTFHASMINNVLLRESDSE
ncbi:cell cycle checkpoint control protein RAD9A isoform X1 [Euwallacea fornicatus]|uniref:cell cycle checkpoint control protein RAD9A isoform X1 n=2 Tax=Euwallacea fornicatus TaxID=995702 RepID=UPI00338EF524